MSHLQQLLTGVCAVAVGDRALVVEGPPGSGKSSLALALIDRGAVLIGDDGVMLQFENDRLFALPPPNIAGLIEVRNVGLVTRELAPPAPLGLILCLQDNAERLPDSPSHRDILGCSVPTLTFTPGSIAPAVRAEIALSEHGRVFD